MCDYGCVTYAQLQLTVASVPLWNVKFYPYGHPEDDPVFAVIGDVNVSIYDALWSRGRANNILQTIVYKLVGGAEGNLERLCWFQDEGVS